MTNYLFWYIRETEVRLITSQNIFILSASVLVLYRQGHVWFVHDDVIKWKHFPRYWPFARGIHRSPVNSPHTGQWRGALMFSLICVWINGWVNNREAGGLRRYRAHYDVTVMESSICKTIYIFRLQHCLDRTDISIDKYPGGRLNKKDGLTRYGDSHVKDKTS